MLTISLSEHERLYRWDKSGTPPDGLPYQVLSARLFRRLHRFDEQLQRQHKAVFEWRVDYVKAQQWVGVIQLEGLRIEILPKIDAVSNNKQGLSTDKQSTKARENLLTMLQIAGDIPLRSRDMAHLTRSKAPLSEHLIATFASQLQEELLKGPIRNYVRSEDNLGLMRGKLKMGTHIMRNHSRRDRFYCEFDEFTANNQLNQIFKYSCKLLLKMTRRNSVHHDLQHCMLILDDVADTRVTVQQLDAISFTRQNDRFKRLFAFCRLVIESFAPSISGGKHACFSMLFDMNQVFERFVAAFMQKHIPLVFENLVVIPQAKHRKTHLLQHGGIGRLPLKPDILIEQHDKSALIIDTKWKALTTGTKTGRGGTSREDLYQMHAYSQRFGVAHSTLLYPWVPGEQPREFDVMNELGKVSNKTISIRYVNVSRPLDKTGLLLLKDELSALVAELLPDAPDVLSTGVAQISLS
jgi:5-methylcytosine-specific restriction enzyme subunit McrC